MTGVQLLALDRLEGVERIALGFDLHDGLEFAIERRTRDGCLLLRRVVFDVDELETIRDAIGRAIALREAVQ